VGKGPGFYHGRKKVIREKKRVEERKGGAKEKEGV